MSTVGLSILVLVAGLAHTAPLPPEARQEPPEQQAEQAPLGGLWPRWPLQEDDDGEPERGFFPLVGTVVAGSGFSAGVGYRDYGLFGSPVGFEVTGLASLRGYQLYRAHFGLLSRHRRILDLRPADETVSSLMDDRRHARPGVAVYLDARYRYLPRSWFYGIGPDSRKADRADYLLKGGALDLVVQGQVTPTFGFSARAGVLGSAVDEGRDGAWPAAHDQFTEEQAPGLLDPPRYMVAGLGAAFDTRDDLDDRRRAVFLSAAAWRFDQTDGDRFDFTRLAVDARVYLAPPLLPGLVAVRTLVATDLADERDEVPFFIQNALGGTDSLRAFGASRWQDTAVAHAAVEYRVLAHRLVEVAPFLDVGAVGPGLSRIVAGKLKVGGGIGLRARWNGATIARMDWAWGSEGKRVVLDTGVVF